MFNKQFGPTIRRLHFVPRGSAQVHPAPRLLYEVRDLSVQPSTLPGTPGESTGAHEVHMGSRTVARGGAVEHVVVGGVSSTSPEGI